MGKMTAVLLCLTVLIPLTAAEGANPIGQVIKMLNGMRSKVVSVGEEEQKAYEEFASLCKEQSGTLQRAIQTGKDDVEGSGARMTKASSSIEEATSTIADASALISNIDAELAKRTEVRNGEKADFAETEKELMGTVTLLENAHAALTKAFKGNSFLQTSRTGFVDQESIRSILSVLQGSLTALSGKNQQNLDSLMQTGGDGDGSGILELVGGMIQQAEDELAEARKDNTKKQNSFDMFHMQSQNEMGTAEKERADAKAAQASAQKALAADTEVNNAAKAKLNEDQTSLEDLRQSCMNRATDFEAEVKERNAEIAALSKATEIIQSTTGGASAQQGYSLIQMSARVELDAGERNVVAILKKTGLALIANRALATFSLGGPFDKVKKMISEMVAKLQQEAAEEASHKAFCDAEMKKSDAQKENLGAELDKLNTRKDETDAASAQAKEKILASQTELDAIVKSQAEMDATRSDERKVYEAAKADYEQGVAGVQAAIKVLRDYYNSKGEALLQTGDANGIISMMEVAESDFSKSLTTVNEDEASAVDEYERVTGDNRVRQAQLETQLKSLNASVSSYSKRAAENAEDLEATQAEMDAVMESRAKLQKQCVPKPESYEERAKRRQEEIAGLKNALEILDQETA